jgi:hypothetical protein
MSNTIPIEATYAFLPGCTWLRNHLRLSRLRTITKLAVMLPIYEVVKYLLGELKASALDPISGKRVRP